MPRCRRRYRGFPRKEKHCVIPRNGSAKVGQIRTNPATSSSCSPEPRTGNVPQPLRGGRAPLAHGARRFVDIISALEPALTRRVAGGRKGAGRPLFVDTLSNPGIMSKAARRPPGLCRAQKKLRAAKGYRIDDLLEEIRCECGRVHRIRTRRVDIGPSRHASARHMKRFPAGRILLIADANTWKAAGREAADGMRAGRNGLPCSRKNIHTDERAVGSVMLAAEPQPGLLVAVGQHQRFGPFCATRMGIPYLVPATAASVDGYASDVTPVMRGDQDSYRVSILRSSPPIRRYWRQRPGDAGRGERSIIGKHTALDWLLAQTMTGESIVSSSQVSSRMLFPIVWRSRSI